MAEEICSYQGCGELAFMRCSCSSFGVLLCKSHIGDHLVKLPDQPHRIENLCYELRKDTAESMLSVLNQTKSAMMQTKNNFFSALNSLLMHINKLSSEWNIKMNEHISGLDRIIEEVAFNPVKKKGSKVPQFSKFFSHSVTERQAFLNQFKLEPKKYDFASLNELVNSSMPLENDLGIPRSYVQKPKPQPVSRHKEPYLSILTTPGKGRPDHFGDENPFVLFRSQTSHRLNSSR